MLARCLVILDPKSANMRPYHKALAYHFDGMGLRLLVFRASSWVVALDQESWPRQSCQDAVPSLAARISQKPPKYLMGPMLFP